MSKKVSELPEQLTPLSPNDLLMITTSGISKSTKYGNLTASDSIDIVGGNIDWDLGDAYWDDIAVNTSYTFTNATKTKSIIVAVTNTSGATITVGFPSPIYKEAGTLDIDAGQAAIYTFIRINSKIYLSSITNLILS